MGNIALKCMNGPCTVRVLQADGSMREFGRPLSAAQVTLRFPDYVVARYTPIQRERLTGAGRLKVLRPSEILLPGRIYILYPVTAENKHGKDNCGITSTWNSSPMEWSQFQSVTETLYSAGFAERKRGRLDDTRTTGYCADRKSSRTGSSARHLLLLNSGQSQEEKVACPLLVSKSSSRAVSAEQHLRLLLERVTKSADASCVKETSTFQQNDHKVDYVRASDFAGWRPGLWSIPESPLGFHSIPPSPATPIAFRIVSASNT